MDLAWWGWLLVALWLAAGAGGFVVGFLIRFESPKAAWYFLVDEEGIRPAWLARRLLLVLAILLFSLLLGPLGLAVEVSRRRRQRREAQLREARRLRREQNRADKGIDPVRPA